MTDDEIIAVVQAHKEGRIVEFRFLHGSDKQWRFCGYGPFQWNLDQHEYRVAPEPRKPREFWITTHPHYSPVQYNPFPGSIHVREILE